MHSLVLLIFQSVSAASFHTPSKRCFISLVGLLPLFLILKQAGRFIGYRPPLLPPQPNHHHHYHATPEQETWIKERLFILTPLFLSCPCTQFFLSRPCTPFFVPCPRPRFRLRSFNRYPSVVFPFVLVFTADIAALVAIRLAV